MGFAISTTGKIYKSTPQSWFLYETVGDPGGTAQGAVFTSCSMDIGRFVIGAPSALGNPGMAIFGKIKE